uniref:Peptidase S1 domain-containing protein n=1 Tax=Romanomermis culicivorax TaxID=13658 RepID=A0A915I900_ROMCU
MRMFGGERASILKNPWHVQICLQQFDLKKNHCNLVMCGAALIKMGKPTHKHPGIVLTAAHCVTSQGRVIPKNDVNLYMGSNKPTQGSKFRVKKIVVHPKFDIATMEHDIAILILPDVVGYSKNIQGILLPKLEEQTPPKNNYCKVSGFGLNCEA